MNEWKPFYLYIYYLPIHAVVDGCSVNVCMMIVFSQIALVGALTFTPTAVI